MSRVMMTVRSATPPTLNDIRQKFGLSDDDLDAQFGIVEIDPEEHLYSFMVDEEQVAKVSGHEGFAVSGPYSNPRISTFGPPQP